MSEIKSLYQSGDKVLVFYKDKSHVAEIRAVLGSTYQYQDCSYEVFVSCISEAFITLHQNHLRPITWREHYAVCENCIWLELEQKIEKQHRETA